MAKKSSKTGFCEFDFTGCFGSQEPQDKVKEFVLNTWYDNVRMEKMGMPRQVVNVWGASGTAKTSCMKSFKDIEVEYNGEMKKFKIVDIPLGQLEEMGDLLGIPNSFMTLEKDGEQIKVLAENSVLEYHFKQGWNPLNGGKTEMNYDPPAWVPKEECPGLIILDDANRASIRILKGIMQLVQDYRTVGWEIPKGWMICCTGNPDNNHYIVASQDDAMLTRMKHITMNPSVEQWCEWARTVNLDDRGVSFLLTNPEMIYPVKDANGNISGRTNLRTITAFFMCLERYPKITDSNKKMFLIDGKSCVDDDFVNQFYLFLTRDYSLTLSPLDVLEDPDKTEKEVKEWMSGKEKRIDMLNITLERLLYYMKNDDYQYDEDHKINIAHFLLMDIIPQSMVHSALKRISEIEKLKNYLRGIKEYKQFILEMMRINA